ncbi:SCF ubiquitin ligase complex subunit cdc4 [Marasmius crinis-equi]|uniref:SCF ubiquitin ligase complex subunit cdc4 n=1 Tax=Marasmius crinis-equi TaxID=585013 RepID=A0ABR3EQY4_9AGAR
MDSSQDNHPNDDLPIEYRALGTRVGDVGLITSDGCFDFLFDVCLPSNDPINQYNGVPSGFTPLIWDRRCSIKSRWFRPQKPIRNQGSIQWNLEAEVSASVFGLPAGACSGIGVEFSRERGAAVMPGLSGADRIDASNKAVFFDYVSRNGESWYRYINGTLGRQADNGEVYFITGYDKTNSWENAVVYGSFTSGSCKLALTTAGLGPEARLRLSHSTLQQCSFTSRCSSDESLHNQSLFVRGFRVSVRQGRWPRPTIRVELASTYKSSEQEILDRFQGGIPFGGNVSSTDGQCIAATSGGGMGTPRSVASSPSIASLSSGSDLGSEDFVLESDGSDTSVEEDDFIPLSKVYHPLVAINEYVLRTVCDLFTILDYED